MHLDILQLGIRKRNVAAKNQLWFQDVARTVLSHWPSSSFIPLRHHYQRKFRHETVCGWGGGSCHPWVSPSIKCILSSIPIPWGTEKVTGERPHLSKATHLKRHQETFCWGRVPNWASLKASWSPKNTTIQWSQWGSMDQMKVTSGIWVQGEQGKHHPHHPHPFQIPLGWVFSFETSFQTEKNHDGLPH